MVVKMKTYISENKFQFITDFSRHAYTDVKGEAHELNFGNLSISERIMLSSYLTLLCSNNADKIKKQNLYNLIFNFNNKKQRKTSYQDAFIEDISNFIYHQPYYFAFIKSHFKDIENDKTFIYRQQLNHSEMEVLYSLMFQRNYHSLMNVLYIIGVAKQNITTAYLNKLPISNIYPSSPTLGKKRVEEIFEKINLVSKNKVKYKIHDGVVYFGNGFSIDEADEYQSEEKKLFNKMQIENDIINELCFKKEDEEKIKSTKDEEIIIDDEEVPLKPVEKKIQKPNIGNLGDFDLDKEMCIEFLNEHENEFLQLSNRVKNDGCKKLGILNESLEISKLIAPCISSGKDDICKIYHGGFIEGADGLDRKKVAEYKIQQIRKKIFKYLSKLYDEDKEKYQWTLIYFLANFKKILDF